MKDYDLIVVGSGLTGSLVAYLAAKKNKSRVLIIEKRAHIGGNMYDEVDKETGILIQRYGPHSFHTDKKEIYELMREIGEFVPYTLRARVEIKGKLTPSPFNFTTIDTFFDHDKAAEIKKHLVDCFDYAPKVTIKELLSCGDPVIKEYADFLFENDYRPYTAKQWGIAPEELDPSVLARVPVRLSYIDAYFDDRYQMMPKGGFTKFVEKMLSNPLIDIKTNIDATEVLKTDSDGSLYLNGEKVTVPVVYTGPLDELFSCCFGKLSYRSLRFDYKTYDTPSFQETSGVAFPKAEGYTRTTEFSKLPYQYGHEKTVVAYEYPEKYGSVDGKIPYYPILTKETQASFAKYKAKADKYKLLFPCGRLADFRYYNMDDAAARAVAVYDNLVKEKMI